MNGEFAQEIKNTVSESVDGIHTAIPGRITKYDPAKCEAEISPYGKFKKPNGEYLSYPQLNHVPVLLMQSCGQDFTIAYPVKPGDECLILVQEQTLDVWRGSGAQSDNELKFDLTNSVAIVGLFSKPQPIAVEAQSSDAVIIQKNGHRFQIAPSDMLMKFSDDVNISMDAAGVTITAPLVNINGNVKVTGDVENTGDMKTGGKHSDSIGGHV